MAKVYKLQQEMLIPAPPEDLNESVRDAMNSIFSRKYWKPTLQAFNNKLQELMKRGSFSEKKASVVILNYLAEILEDSEPAVMSLIKQSGKDIKQSRLSVAGNNFQALVAHSLLLNVLVGNIPKLEIVLKPKRHPIIEKYGVIKIAGEEQKPDMDVLIYQDKPNTPIIICSCKTSLRERAGQTYRWKLLMDLATTDSKHLKTNPDCPINKYKIEYRTDRKIFVVMVTADLYNEVDKPQQRGMFSFFDKAFVADKGKTSLPLHVEPMSQIISYLNSIYKD